MTVQEPMNRNARRRIKKRQIPGIRITLFRVCLLVLPFCNLATAINPDTTLKLTPGELSWLSENADAIRYGPNPSWPPGDYIEDGVHKGIVSDYIRIFESKLDIKFKKVKYNDWEHLYNGLKNAEFDFVGACQETEERKTFLLFTEPFLTTRLAVLTRSNGAVVRSLDDLNSMTLAGIKGYSSTDYVRTNYPGAKIVECEDDLTALLKVSAGAVDGAVADYMVASYLVDKYSVTNLEFAMELDFHWDLRFAVRKEKPVFRSVLDKVLGTISEEQRRKIYHKWVSIRLEHKPGFFERNRKIIMGMFSAILFVLFVVLLFNRSLKKQVSTRTKELKISAERLRESKEYLQAVLDSAGDGVLVHDADSARIIDVNHRMCEMCGYSYAEVLQLGIGELSHGVPPYSQGDALQWLSRARGNSPQTFEWLMRHKDGRTSWVEVKVNFAVIGGADRFVVVVRDITERKRIEEQLVKAQKLESLGILAGGIAHDFNNLLCGIYGNLDMAIENERDETVLQYLSKTMNTIERARSLTQQLLTFSKGGAPVQKIAPLIPFINETVQFAISGSNVSCRFYIQDDLWNCNYDRNQIGQVIDNIVINALQAMPAGGNICVSACNISFAEREHPLLSKGEYVRVSVRDSGVGIPAEVLDKIFDPFFSTKSRGHGLGLATSFSIVKRHNGCIDVDSKPGNGSVFHVYLPAADKECIPEDEKGREKKIIGSGTILVMDDEKVIRETIRAMLTSLGFTVVCKDNGKDAVSYVASELMADRTISGAIVDLTVPGGMGGKDAVAEIRKMDATMPVFVTSGYADDPVMKNPQEYGFTASICKPFRKVELVEILGKYIKSKPSD